MAEALAEYFGSLERLMAAPAEEVEGIPGLGPKLAAGVTDWFSHAPNRRVVDKLAAAGVRLVDDPAVEQDTGSQPLAGQTWVVTGTLPTLSREAATALIKAHGGKVTSSVSAQTSFVLAGDKPGSKLDAARKLGVPVADEAELRRQIG